MKLLIVLLASALVASSHAQDELPLRGLERRGREREHRRSFGKGGGSDGGGSSGKKGGFGGKKGGSRGKGGFFGLGLYAGNCYWGADGGQPLFDEIQDECDNEPISCDDAGALDCSVWKTWDDDFPLVEGCIDDLTNEQKDELRAMMRAKKEEWKAMSDEERDALRQAREEAKEANKATVLGCSCCLDGGTDNIADIVDGKEGIVAKMLGFRKTRGEGGRYGRGGAGR